MDEELPGRKTCIVRKVRRIILMALICFSLVLGGIGAVADQLPGDFKAFLRGHDLQQRTATTGDERVDPTRVSDDLNRLIDEANTMAEYRPVEGAKHASAFLFDGKALRVDPDGSEHTLTRKTIKLLTDHPGEMLEIKIHFNAAVENIEFIFARIITVDGRIVPVSPANLPVLAPYEITPFYAGLKTQVIAFPECKAGSVLDYEIIIHRKNALVPGEFEILFSLQGLVPYLRNCLAVAVPGEKQISIKTTRLKSLIHPERMMLNGRRVLVWISGVMTPLSREPNMPQYADIVPYLTVTSMGSWNVIAEKFLPRAQNAVVPSDSVTDKVNILIDGAGSLEEKVCRVFEFVQREIIPIKVDLVENGLNFIPAERVLNQGYGASLEKCSLLLSMLKVIGVRAVHGLISTRENGRIQVKSPMLSQFNHVIVLAEVGGELIFMDPFAEWLTYPSLPVEDQDRFVLPLEPGCTGLIKTPQSSEDDNFVRERLELELLPGGDVEVRALSTAGGEVDRSYRREFATLNNDRLKMVLSQAVNAMFTGAYLINYYVSDPTDMSKRLTMGLTFRSPGQLKKKGDKYILNIPGLHQAGLPPAEPGRRYPLCFRFPFKAETEIIVFYPDNLKPVFLPDDIDYNDAIGQVTARYRVVQPGRLNIRFSYVRRITQVEDNDFPEYRRLASKIALFSGRPVTFREVAKRN